MHGWVLDWLFFQGQSFLLPADSDAGKHAKPYRAHKLALPKTYITKRGGTVCVCVCVSLCVCVVCVCEECVCESVCVYLCVYVRVRHYVNEYEGSYMTTF